MLIVGQILSLNYMLNPKEISQAYWIELQKLAQEKIKTTKAQNALTEQETRIKEKANNSTKKELDFFQN